MLGHEFTERLSQIRTIEERLNAKVISFYQNPRNMGEINDYTAQSVSDVLSEIDPYSEIVILIDSPGGYLWPSWKIAVELSKRDSFVRAVIPREAKSAATLIALAADSISMFELAELGPLDPQVEYKGRYVSALDLRRSSDRVLRSMAMTSINQMREYIQQLIGNRYKKKAQVDKLVNRLLLIDKKHASHSSSIFYKEATKLGLSVSTTSDLDLQALHQMYKKHQFCEHDPSTIVEFLHPRLVPTL